MTRRLGPKSAAWLRQVGIRSRDQLIEAGTVAAFIGVVPAVVMGGIGTLIVAGLWAWWFPAIRRVRRLDGRG